MHLTQKEVERFYNIWFPLLYFVNQRREVVPSFPKVWKNANIQTETAVAVRDVLWEDDSLREAFIAENPAGLNDADLALVDSWKWRVSGDFFIFRHLKKYTIFIDSNSPATGYGVHGITNSFEDIIGHYLPIYTQAVLLPFEDRIIYDSLLASYRVHFGGGYKSSLKDTYRRIQECGRLLTSLQPGQVDDLEIAQVSNKKVLSAFQKALGKAGLTPKKIQEHLDVLTRFAEDFLHQQQPPGMLLDITSKNIKAYRTSTPKKINLVSFKRFTWFLRDSGRIYWDEAEELLDYLKQIQKNI